MQRSRQKKRLSELTREREREREREKKKKRRNTKK